MRIRSVKSEKINSQLSGPQFKSWKNCSNFVQLCKTARFIRGARYADDVKLFSSSKAHNELQKSIDSIFEWGLQWNMKLSIPKCSAMHFGKCLTPNVYTLDGQRLRSDEGVRDLGIYMTRNLCFDDHIHSIVKKAKSRINNILRAFKCNDLTFLVRAFSIYVRPLLESATVVWNPTKKGLIAELESVQRQFTRRVFARSKQPAMSYENRLLLTGLESLEKRRMARDLEFLFNTIHENVLYDSSFVVERAPLTRSLRTT